MNSFFASFTSQSAATSPTHPIFSGLTVLCLIFTAIFSSGCSSANKPASASFAGVIIANCSAQQIRDATETVFTQNGYRSSGQQGDALVFEREATGREQREYAGFVGAHEGEKVDIRVRVKIETKDPTSFWLTCKAYAITNPGQGIFETSTALFNFQSDSYQKLMDKVKGTVQRPVVMP
jgi:hypothetical protein